MVDGLLDEAQRYVSEYGYSVVFVLLFLESFGLPMPGETFMIAGSILAARGQLNIYWLALICWLAAVAGDNLGYLIGRKGGRVLVLKYGPRVGIKPRHIHYVEEFFRRHGGAVVLVARFFAVLRQLNGVVAGTMGMNWWHFLAYNALGAALWVAFWTSVSFWFGKRLHEVLNWIGKLEPILVTAAIIAGVVAIAVLWRRQRGRKRGRGRR